MDVHFRISKLLALVGFIYILDTLTYAREKPPSDPLRSYIVTYKACNPSPFSLYICLKCVTCYSNSNPLSLFSLSYIFICFICSL
ncbi:hypothetical protein RJT34_31689 [Clitoria ternatea]|uniref:Uncharacterized protein n=1 Tax=Clitoria ternatea TaxID=43366 RepID=A0AAN9I8M8_CLITE